MKKRQENMLALKIIVGLQVKRVEDWLRKVGLYKGVKTEEELYRRPFDYKPSITQVVEDTNHDISIPSDSDYQPRSIFDYMSDELKELYEQDIRNVHALFTNKMFVQAYVEKDNDTMLSIIELFYYEGLVDYELLNELVKNKLVVLSEENIAHFKKIGLIPTFNNGDSGTSLS